jgi:hypothetical protein
MPGIVIGIMRRLGWLALLAVLAFAADDEAWRSKQIAEWTEADARLVLADSPWAKSFTPTLGAAEATPQQPGRGMRRGRIGIPGIGGINTEIPGIGGGLPPTGGSGADPQTTERPTNDKPITEAPKVTVRWESALPIRSAELKIRDNDAPILDEKHYAIAVYGIPEQLIAGDTQKLAAEFRKDTVLRRDGKKDLKPSSVEVFDGQDGRVMVFLFPNSTEISKEDHRVEFNAKIGRLDVIQSFFPDDMVWQDKLQL